MEKKPSPNFNDRPEGRAPDMLILHYTGLPSADESLGRLCDASSKVSAHYFVDEDGSAFQMVDENKRAWHAGVSCWDRETDINSRSIGIEIQNPGHEFGYRPFPGKQVEAVITLCLEILERYEISPARVLGHSDVAPFRKEDPGELFPWRDLSARGVGLWPADKGRDPQKEISPESPEEEIRTFQGKLLNFGYCLEETGNYDRDTRKIVTAFQRHWRQDKIDGLADCKTLAILDRLLEMK